MDPAQNKPPRKRRRWLIVALVLVSMATWWYWPRGDARFVGKWTMQWTLVGDTSRNIGEVTFCANGQLSVRGEGFPGNGGIFTGSGFVPTNWVFDRNTLLIRGSMARLPSWLYQFTWSHNDWFPGALDAWREDAWTIEESSGSRIELWAADNGHQVLKLTRIPE